MGSIVVPLVSARPDMNVECDITSGNEQNSKTSRGLEESSTMSLHTYVVTL